MPELPEVETTLRGIKPYLVGKKILGTRISHYQLRWPILSNLNTILTNQTVHHIERRAKYLVFSLDHGSLIIHLGMSGHLSLLTQPSPPNTHDHCDLMFTENYTLRYHDPRRFGAIIWTDQPITQHPLFTTLGPEPLTADFSADYLMQRCHNKKASIKSIIMDSHVVVGIGNIYASEALFLAGIHPEQAGGLLDKTASERLTTAIKQVLEKSILAGGTSLKDFFQADGKPGYFKQELHVYGQHHKPCTCCKTAIKLIYQQKRASYFCPTCQPETHIKRS